jgi:hypothetical protein
MTTHPIADHRSIAMKLLTSGAPLRPKEGQFLGGIAFDANALTEKQANWLSILIERYGINDAAKGGAA